MRIKVCGITRQEDADAACALGVDALGFVLWPRSPRAIALDAAGAIIERLPPLVMPVGVFVDPSTEDLERARQAGVMLAQVHGAVPAGWPSGLALLRAVSLAPEGTGLVPATEGTSPVLVDAWDPVRRGGTGRTVNWEAVRPIARTRPVVLAGGLTPANVATAIEQARPWAVDVSSGVELAPGIKDHAVLAAFVAAVKAGA